MTAPTGGTVTSGVNMNRDHVSFPDAEQDRRFQAREESRWAAGARTDHPENTRAFDNDFVKAQQAAQA